MTAVLKKLNADPDELRNYLTFSSKVTKQSVEEQITQRFNDMNLMPELKSA